MTPYGSLMFIILLTAVLLPAVVLGLFEVKLKWYGLAATLVMLWVIFDTAELRFTLSAFCLVEVIAVKLYEKLRNRYKVRPLLWIFIAVSIAPLALVKLGDVAPGLAFIRLLGVSYMTFRAVQVLIELYDGLIDSVKTTDFVYFLLFFPTVSSGPIDRYRPFVAGLGEKVTREEYLRLVKRGVWSLAVGALFNFGIGNIIWENWLAKLPDAGFFATISYMYGYTFFLFFNFAGYSLMAIGASNFLGLSPPQNFNLPFLSHDMKDFWSRWHMSLSGWLRDYVYSRFVASALRKEWFKDRRTSSYIGYVITMLTMGIWHGLTLSYIVYGAYHATLMCVNEALDTRWKRFRKLKKGSISEPILILITFHLFSFGLLIFSGRLF